MTPEAHRAKTRQWARDTRWRSRQLCDQARHQHNRALVWHMRWQMAQARIDVLP